MKDSRTSRYLRFIFLIEMLACVAILIWNVFASASVSAQLDDMGRSLETALGRERKQQREYDQTVEKIASAREELDAILPEAEAVRAAKADQVAERKALRARKEELEAQLAELTGQDEPEEEESADE